MTIRQVGGAGGFDRGVDRLRANDRQRDANEVRQGADRDSDTASISAASRETAQAVEGLAERLQGDDAERDQQVEAAIQRLETGALDDPAVYRAVAERLLRGGF